MGRMSCITITGRKRRWNIACDLALPRTPIPWTNSKADRLYRFARSEDPVLRAIAANHPKTRFDVLLQLLEDRDARVRRAAVKNTGMTRDLLMWMRDDPDTGIASYARMRLEE